MRVYSGRCWGERGECTMENEDAELINWIEYVINKYYDGFETDVRESFIEELLRDVRGQG